MSDTATAVATALRAGGIEHVFGLPGTQSVALFEALRVAGIRTVLSSHEAAAAFMANGYYRASGRVAGVAAIPGPGFTYALTGVAEARLDSAGLLFLVPASAAEAGKPFQLQAIEQRSIVAPLVKGIVPAPGHAAEEAVRHALDLASNGEPGPVLVELSRDSAAAAAPGSWSADGAPAGLDARAADELESRFDRADHPVLLLGQGAVAAAARLEALANALAIPVVTTPSGRGIVPEDAPVVLGFDPLRGHLAELNEFLAESDLILGLGCKLGHNGSAGFGLRLPPDRFVQVDASATVLGATYPAGLTLHARVEDVVERLARRTAPARWDPARVARLREVVRAVGADVVEPVIRGRANVPPREFFRWLRGALPRDAIVVTDSGLHQILTRRYLDVLAPRGLICPSDFQAMGFGLPAAIGARLAAPERPLIALIGDGGFLMSGWELLTARREGVPLLVIVFNDGQLNQIRLQQLADSGHAHAVRLLNPDFAALAAALGIEYLRFGELTEADLRRALSSPDVVLLEVPVGDSLPLRVLPLAAQAKGAVRKSLGPRSLAWIKARLRRR